MAKERSIYTKPPELEQLIIGLVESNGEGLRLKGYSCTGTIYGKYILNALIQMHL